MARRSAASPLANFLDYVVTAPLAEATAAIEASIAIMRMRKALPLVAAATRARRVTTAAAPTAAPAAAPAAAERPGPVAVPAPAARTPARRRGRPVGSTKVAKPAKVAKAGTATRRRRPAVDAPAVSVPVEDLPPSHTPLPEQIVDGDEIESGATV